MELKIEVFLIVILLVVGGLFVAVTMLNEGELVQPVPQSQTTLNITKNLAAMGAVETVKSLALGPFIYHIERAWRPTGT